MAQAIADACEELGADLAAVADSEMFMANVGPLSASDGTGIRTAVQAAMVANPSLKKSAPGMRPNAAQGANAPVATQATGSVAERMQQKAAQQLDQPTAPGSTR